jgi:UDP-N-acetylmuramate dehydrogenase
MQIQENVGLAHYSTMRLGGKAKYLAEVTSEQEAAEALAFARDKKLAVHIVGEGSNTVFGDKGFDGLVIVNKIKGIQQHVEGDALILEIGAGENWDSIVALSVMRNYSDIAALSLIPGSTGAAPVQNIGAYGQQISDSIKTIKTLEVDTGKSKEFRPEECQFAYRRSRFNQVDKEKYLITSVILQLRRNSVSPPFYADVEHYFATHNIAIDKVTPQQLREAVMVVRRAKLPDPATVANCGSFFRNPVVTEEQFSHLVESYPHLRAHKTDDGNLKLYAGQLIELGGLKGYRDKPTGMATWPTQALVLVNEKAKSTADLLAFKQKIIANVQAAFNITLEQEPEFIEK